MKKVFGIVLLATICLLSAANAVEYPQFKSAISTTGIMANFDTVYSRADQLKMIHDVKDHDSKHVIWTYKDTGNWVIMKDDGTLVITSPSAFSIDVKKVLNNDLTRAKDLITSTGGSTSGAPLIYYVDDPYLYRFITYDFSNNFDLNLNIPDCTLQMAMLDVSGSDYTEIAKGNNDLKVPGQHYLIDDKEASGCDGTYCSLENGGGGIVPRGISCVPQSCKSNTGSGLFSLDHTNVNVEPVDITNKIATGIHKISARGIDNQHKMIVEAVTSPSNDGMLLYSDDYGTMINETRSSPMSELYALIQPNTGAFNTTSNTMITNATV